MSRRWRCHRLEWEAQGGLINVSKAAVLCLVKISRRLCQVQLIQLVSDIAMVVLNTVAASWRQVNIVFADLILVLWLRFFAGWEWAVVSAYLGRHKFPRDARLGVLSLLSRAIFLGIVLVNVVVLHNFCEDLG